MVSRCVAVAGMAMWYPSDHYKMAAWIGVPRAKLRNGRCLTLGTCNVSTEYSGRPGEIAERVVFVAGRDSHIWKSRIMFGASCTPFSCASLEILLQNAVSSMIRKKLAHGMLLHCCALGVVWVWVRLHPLRCPFPLLCRMSSLDVMTGRQYAMIRLIVPSGT